MSRFEDELRETFRRNAPDPATVRPPTWEAPEEPGEPRRRLGGWLLPVLAAACVAIVLLGAAAVARGSIGTKAAPASTPAATPVPSPTGTNWSIATPNPMLTMTPSASAPVAPVPASTSTPTPTAASHSAGTPAGTTARRIPAGLKAIRYRGIEILVDKDLKLDDFNCGEQQGPTVVVGPMPTKCDDSGGVMSVSDTALIRVLPSDSAAGQELTADATNRVTVDGVTAYTSCKKCSSADIANGTFSESDGGTLYFPKQKVVIDAYTTMIGGAPDTILHTVRVL